MSSRVLNLFLFLIWTNLPLSSLFVLFASHTHTKYRLQRVRAVLEEHLRHYQAQHNPTYDPERPFETGLLPLLPASPTAGGGA